MYRVFSLIHKSAFSESFIGKALFVFFLLRLLVDLLFGLVSLVSSFGSFLVTLVKERLNILGYCNK
jgi:hypothetical protein